MRARIARSTLILPVNVPRFIEKAHTRHADAVTLDLEDSVPPAEKATARTSIRDAARLVARGGAEVSVRVNNEPELIHEDVDAAVQRGIEALTIPKVESPDQVRELAAQVERLEHERGIAVGHIALSLIIESPRGLLHAEEIAAATPRTASMSVGPEDYCLALGVEPSPDGAELAYPVARLVTICKALGLTPTGLLGSIAGFRDLDTFEMAAARARQLGCEGGGCIHPDQVPILNRVFSPAPDKVEHARRVVEAFEEGLVRGTASVNLDGRMVDVPVYRRARLILDRAAAIAAVERRKAEAVARL